MGLSIFTKVESLEYIKKTLGDLVFVDKLFAFTLKEWEDHKSDILTNVRNSFNLEEILIVRSSAVDEDNPTLTFAGFFCSVMGVKNSEVEILDAVEQVIFSYSKNGRTPHPSDQVFIQPQLVDSIMSGVLFTVDPRLEAPYYVINYDDNGGTTNRVTQGLSNKAIRIARWLDLTNIPSPWKQVVSTSKRIECAFPSLPLDIEFGIDGDSRLHVFQTRILPSALTPSDNSVQLVSSEVEYLQDKVDELTRNNPNNLLGSRSILTDMSDWNPAEILGGRPNLLDSTIYRYLVTKSTWNHARHSLGYTSVDPAELMVLIGDKPYIDTRVSFNSLTPEILDESIRNKLINYYLNKLQSRPELQDKIEFEIVLSNFDQGFYKKAKELIGEGFNKADIANIETALFSFTDSILLNSNNFFDQDLNAIKSLNANRIVANEMKSPFEMLENANKLLNRCKNFGVLPFSRLARLAFIGISLLNTLVDNGTIRRETSEAFFASLQTITKQLIRDFNSLDNGRLLSDDFIDLYGHLRLGTYNILSPRYIDLRDIIFTSNHLKNPMTEHASIDLNSFDNNEIVSGLSKYKFSTSPQGIIDFIKKSIEYREFSKFEFSKSLSNAIELIAQAGNLLGFSREEMASLSLDQIMITGKVPLKDVKFIWQDLIWSYRSRKSIWSHIALPSVIISRDDLLIIPYCASSPNFVTQQSVEGELILIDSIDQKSLENLNNRIVLIENADPGFDWIFTRNLKGLITKYGGVASHMAVRCTELGIPAAIGCGELIFERLASANRVTLNCAAETIVPI